MQAIDLRSRLQRVSGRPVSKDTALASLPEEIAAKLSPSLAERLARLRPANAGLGPRRPADKEAAHHLGGELVSPGLVRVARRYPLPLSHGISRIEHPGRLWWRNPRYTALCDQRLGFIDTETTGLAGGTGTLAFVTGLATIDPDGLTLCQWILLGFGAEAAMLDALASQLGDVAAVVSYNGKAFDLPLLQTRYRMQGKVDPFGGLSHIDLLPWTRAHRPATWDDSRLQTVERGWFGLRRDDDIPGAAIPGAWRAWLDRGALRDLGRVVRHHRLDILSLIALLQRAVEYEPDDLLRERPREAGNGARRKAFLLAGRSGGGESVRCAR